MSLQSSKRATLFLCTHNAARSQIAEALLRHHGGDDFEVYSAGTSPTELHPLTKMVMREVGIDVATQRAKGVDAYLGKLSVAYLIIVCEQTETQCPKIWPGALQREFWPFADPLSAPAEQQLQSFREVRDAIEERIIEWLKQKTLLTKESAYGIDN